MSLPSLRPVPSASWKRILASSGADCQGRRQRLCRVLLSGWPSLLIVGGTLALCLHLWGLLRQGHEAELEHARARAEQRATQLARAVRLEIDSSLRSLDIALTYLGEKYDDGPDEFARAAGQMIASYPQGLVQGVAVYGLNGSFLHLTGVFPGRAVPADLLRPRGRDDRSARLDLGPSGGADGADETITLVVPLHRHGVPVVSIGIALRPLALSAHLAALRGQPQDALAVFRSDGRAVAHSRSVEANRLQVPTDRPFLQANQGEEGIFRAPSARDGRPLLLAWQRLQHWPLSVVAAIDEDAEYHSLNQQRDRAEQHAGVVSSLALCFALGVAILIVRVRHGEARSTAMFRRAKLPMLLVDPVGTRIVEANDAAADFYGLDRRGMSGLPLAHIQLPRTVDSTEVQTSGCEYDAWRDGVRQRHWRADHAPRDVEIRCGSLQLGGRPLLYCTVQDITERCAAEDAAAFEANRHAALLATASDGIHILDEDGHLVQFSPSFIAMLGYSDEEAHTLHVACWDVDRTIQDMKETVRQRIISPRTFEARHRRKDGRVLDVEITSRGFTIGGRSYLYASSRDITARKAAEVQLRLAAAAFEAQEGIVVTDKDNRVVRVNRAFTEITGYSADEALGRNPSFLSSGRHDAAFYAAMWEGIRSEGHWKGEIYNRRKSGEVYPEWLTISAVRAADGAITHHVAMLTDISERKAAEREVMRLAFYDPLTQLPNRRLLYDRLQQALAKSARTKLRGAALFIDLDNFKALNDTRGHSTGDLLLQQVAARLQRGVREDDTVARVGADEFVVLLENISPVEDEAAGQARQVAQKLLAGFLEPLVLGGHSLHTTASIGIALFDGQGGGVDETLKRAGMAVDEAKARGRNEMSFFDPVMQALAVARVRLEAELRHGLGNKELVLFYQPQVDRQGSIRGAETLVRWQHPRLGLLQPVDFIDVAERAGLIGPLGLAVLEGACETLVQWSAHPALHHLVLAVNVSALQFSEESFVEEVRRVLEASGADPHRLELELTESALVDDVDAVIAKMHAIKRMGIGLALDDFGTGYSSLSYLSRLPLDQLKIDRSFVKDIEVDDHAAVICSATINLAHSLSLTVVAEGVETEAQRELLSSTYPCDRMQGYRFGRPMTAQAFEEAVLTSLQESESILA